MKYKEEQLYELVILDLRLTKDTLKIYSFTDENIQKLIEEQIIMEINQSEYKLQDIDKFYQYGVKILLNGNIKKANTCFYRCHELNPNHRKACLQVMLSNLKQKKYDKLVTNFIMLENIEPEKYKNDNNLYLYLLNMLAAIPIEYQERLSKIDIDNITNKQDGNDKEYNIRYSIVLNKFTYALRQINDLIAEKRIYNVENEVLKELIMQVATLEREFKTTLFFLAQRKEYQKIVSALNCKSKKRYLKNGEVYIRLVTVAILNIIETKKIPEVTCTNTRSLYRALEGNNFKLALELNKRFMKNTNGESENETFNILLLEINKLIAYLTEEEILKKYEKNDKAFIRNKRLN